LYGGGPAAGYPSSAAPPAPPPPGNPPNTGYGAPPQYYGAPPPYAPQPEPNPDSAVEATNPKRGPYFGAWLGVGGPYGGDTTIGRGSGYSQGAGVLGTAGYAFIPNFGLGLFVHYNTTSIATQPNSATDLSITENSAHVLLYGLEARGIVGAGPVIGWASLGFSFGTGTLSLNQNSTSPPSSSLGVNVTSSSSGDLTFKVMPVIAFGAEVEVTRGLGIGPVLRWYVTNVDSACDTATATISSPTIGPQTNSRTQCASRIPDVTVPDILFLGVGLTYRIET
jgi:hypothetical protein